MSIILVGILLFSLGVAGTFVGKSTRIYFAYIVCLTFAIVIASNDGGGFDYESYESMVYDSSYDISDERIGFAYRWILTIAQSAQSFRLLLILSAGILCVALLTAFKSTASLVTLSSFVFFLLAPSGILHQISELRQAAAVCLFTASLGCLYRRNYKSSLLFAIISIGMHNSAIIAYGFLLFSYLLLRNKIILMMIIVSVLVLNIQIIRFATEFFPVYSLQVANYFLKDNDYGKYYFALIFIFLFAANIYYTKRLHDLNKYLIISLFFAVILGFITYDLGRISYFFMGPVIYILLSEMHLNGKNIKMASIVALTYALSIFCLTIIRADLADNQSFNSYNFCFINGSCL